MTIEKPKCVWERYIKAKDKQKVEIISTITDNIVDTYYDLNEKN